jgi:hypothetical protein
MSTGDRFDSGNFIAAYGMPPMGTSPRVSPWDGGGVRSGEVGNLPAAGTIKSDLKTRIAWLKKELSMHEAYKLELATLERVLAAYDAVPNESVAEEKP